MDENFRKKKERLDTMLAQDKISKIEYDRFLNMLNQNVVESDKCDSKEEEAICADVATNDDVDEKNIQVLRCLDRNIFIAMQEKGLITDDELVYVKDKYFDERPKPTVSESIPTHPTHPTQRTMPKAYIIGIIVITLFFVILLLGALSNNSKNAVNKNQQSTTLVSENQTSDEADTPVVKQPEDGYLELGGQDSSLVSENQTSDDVDTPVVKQPEDGYLELDRDKNSTISLKINSIEDKGKYVIAWTKYIPKGTTLSKLNKIIGNKLYSILMLDAYNKKHKQIMYIKSVYYDKLGAVIKIEKAKQSQWEKIAPNTQYELLYDNVMSVYKKQQSSQNKKKNKQTFETIPTKQPETKTMQTQAYEMPPDTSTQPSEVQPKQEYEMP